MLAAADLSATQLRQDVYRILDRIIASGEPVDIERKGVRLRISLVQAPAVRDLEALPHREHIINGDPEDLVDIDWSDEWKPSRT